MTPPARRAAEELADCIRPFSPFAITEATIAEMAAIIARHFPAQAAGWRPIESAPRDGSHVLLFTTSHGAVEAWYSPGEWSDHFEYGPQYEGAVWVCADDAFQIEVEEGPVDPESEATYWDGPATHWQPLPAAPEPAR